MADGKLPHIVIIGAGFGGMAAAKALAGADVRVTLVDRTNHHVFQPLLYQVATAALSPADIATASRSLLRKRKNVTVLMEEAVGVDPARKTVQIADGDPLSYDNLIIATGCAYSFFGRNDWASNAGTLKTIQDAIDARNRLLGAFERAERCASSEDAMRMLTFVVVGGGPTGVEMAGATAELARTTFAGDFRNIDPRATRVVLCERGDRLLPTFPEKLSRYTERALAELGVEVILGCAVEEITGSGLTVGGKFIATTNIFWCAGTQAEPAAEWLKVEASRNGGIKVGADCSIPAYPDIFAIGDVASYDAGFGRQLPGLAAVAQQQGGYVGRLLAARLSHKREPAPFRYRDRGTMAVIGRSRAVALLGGFKLSGRVAWVAWSLVHLMLLVDFRSRLMVYANWTWAFFTHGRSARIINVRDLPDPLGGPLITDR